MKQAPIAVRSRLPARAVRMLLLVALVAISIFAVVSVLHYRRAEIAASSEDDGAAADAPAGFLELPLNGIDPQVAAAITRAEAAVRVAPRSASAWGTLGMVLEVHDMPQAARVVFAKAELLDPREPRWSYLRGNLLSASRPDLALVALRHAADRCDVAGDGNALPRIRLGELLLSRQQFDMAQPEFDRVLRAEPSDTRAKMGRARCLMERGDVAAAIRSANECVSDPRTHQAAEALLAQAYARQGESDSAQIAAGAAADSARDQSWPDPFLREAAKLAVGRTARETLAGAQLDANHHSEAIDQLQSLIKDYPDDAVAWLLLGRAYIFLSDRPGAERALRHAEQLDPDSVSVQFHLGVMYRAAGDLPRAAACFRKAVARQPDYAAAQFDLGKCLAHLGERKEAASALREAIRYDPSSSRAHSELGRLLAEGDRSELPEAISHLKRAVSLNSADVPAREALQRLTAGQ